MWWDSREMAQLLFAREINKTGDRKGKKELGCREKITHYYLLERYVDGNGSANQNFCSHSMFETHFLHTPNHQYCSVTIADCEIVIFCLSIEGEKLQRRE